MKPLPAVKIWSAVPTPLTPDFRVDEASVERMVHDAIHHGIQGLFLAGTCGEGPWQPDREKQLLVKTAVRAAGLSRNLSGPRPPMIGSRNHKSFLLQ